MDENTIHSSDFAILLYTTPEANWIWPIFEISFFFSEKRRSKNNSRLVCFYNTSVPDPLRDYEAVKLEADDIFMKFLKPLFIDRTFLSPEVEIECSASELDLRNLASGIARKFEECRPVDLQRKHYGDRITVHLDNVALDADGLLPDDTEVECPSGVLTSLGFEKKTFKWGELKERAKPTKRKGTYWLDELGKNICGIARGDAPAMMTSTFRGIGQGKIYHPTLCRVDRNNDRPLRFFVLIAEQIVPEAVRPPGKLGRLFLLIQIASRTRYEVVKPFLSDLRHHPRKLETSVLFKKIGESLDLIIEQAQRDGCYEKDAYVDAFPEDFYETARVMWEERQEIWERTRSLAALRPASDEDASKSHAKSSAWVLKELEKNLTEWRRRNSRFLEVASFCYHVQLRKDYERVSHND